MKEKIKCPNCGKFKLQKEVKGIAAGPGTFTGGYPKEEKRAVYTCQDCNEVFFEEELSNQRK